MYRNTETAYDAFRLFRCFWLLFIIMHMAISSPGWSSLEGGFLSPSSPVFLAANILVIIFALVALFRPEKMVWFLLTIGLLTVVKLDALPVVPNHIILTLIVHFTIFLSLLFYWDKSLNIKERTARWFVKAAPYIRVELLILYFFVVLHKINTDFFNPEVSCATELYADMAGIYPIIPEAEWIGQAVITLTFLPELIIPILLIIPSTRVLGILLGMVFHFILSLHPNLYILSFTAELYALFILFLPGFMITRVMAFTRRLKQRINPVRTTAAVVVFGITVAGLVLAVRMWSGEVSVSLLRSDLFTLLMICWALWSLILMICAVFVFHKRLLLPAQFDSGLKISRSPLLIFPLLMILNGMTPYIGLKTATNFAMFSNLRVDGPDNNHLFMPSSWQISSLQNDTVTLLDTDHPYLMNFIEWNERITWFELSRFLYENRTETLEVSFVRKDSDPKTIRLPEEQTDQLVESGWLARKLLIFRGVRDSGPTPCQW